MEKLKSPKLIITLILFGVGAIVLYGLSGQIMETNHSGHYQIKQAAVTGNMTVHNTPGVYAQMFGAIHTYQISDMNYFSKHDEDGGTGVESAPIKVRFNDGGTAEISGSIKFKLSQTEENQLMLHKDFKSYSAVKQDLVRQVITEALMQTATLMRAEESYSTRRSEFTALAEDQIKFGIFETHAEEFSSKDTEGNDFIERVVRVKNDATGKPMIRKESPFVRYKIEVLQFVIKDIDFDKTIDNLIAKKKEAEQQKVVAKAQAERAKQDAITALEQGKARVAKAKADEEVEKIKEVTQAEKKFEVAQFDRQRAEEEAKAELIKGKAEAEKNKLLVNAGLTPLEKATIQKETSIGVAREMSKVQFPKMLIIGGDSKGGQLNPFDAIGLESFMKITEKMSNQ
jgi:regulator of protease activity HflC (stomatin/prohibitin superfamily)